MTRQRCEKEQEVLEALQSGLTGRSGVELRSHLGDCSSCADLVLVFEALQQEREGVASEVRLPSAAFVWWKAQLRARREATQQALQPVSIALKVAVTCALVALTAAATWEWTHVKPWFSHLNIFASLAGYKPNIFSLQSGFALASGTAFFCLMIFVLYAALADE